MIITIARSGDLRVGLLTVLVLIVFVATVSERSLRRQNKPTQRAKVKITTKCFRRPLPVAVYRICASFQLTWFA